MKDIAKDLEKVFGCIVVDKVFSHLMSVNNRLEELRKSRDKWRKKYEDLKKIHK
jgi:hypothetical protein